MKKGFFVTLIFVFFSLFLLQQASAHLDAGSDKIVGEYITDFGYTPATPIAGEKLLLAFNLANASTEEVISPDGIWVRISQGNEIVFAGTFQPKARHVAFTYAFPESGNYTVDTKYFLGDKVIESSFEINVAQKSSSFHYFDYAIVFTIVAILAIAGFLAFKLYKKR